MLQRSFRVRDISFSVEHFDAAQVARWWRLKFGFTIIALLVFNNIVGLCVDCVVHKVFSLVWGVFTV